MNTAHSALPAWFVLAAALAAPNMAVSGEQRAAFSVTVTLHTALKALSATELCRDGQPLQSPAATIQVECSRVLRPASAQAQQRPTEAPAAAADPQSRPEVTVIF